MSESNCDYAEVWFDKNEIDAIVKEMGIDPSAVKIEYSILVESAIDHAGLHENIKNVLQVDRDRYIIPRP